MLPGATAWLSFLFLTATASAYLCLPITEAGYGYLAKNISVGQTFAFGSVTCPLGSESDGSTWLSAVKTTSRGGGYVKLFYNHSWGGLTIIENKSTCYDALFKGDDNIESSGYGSTVWAECLGPKTCLFFYKKMVGKCYIPDDGENVDEPMFGVTLYRRGVNDTRNGTTCGEMEPYLSGWQNKRGSMCPRHDCCSVNKWRSNTPTRYVECADKTRGLAPNVSSSLSIALYAGEQGDACRKKVSSDGYYKYIWYVAADGRCINLVKNETSVVAEFFYWVDSLWLTWWKHQSALVLRMTLDGSNSAIVELYNSTQTTTCSPDALFNTTRFTFGDCHLGYNGDSIVFRTGTYVEKGDDISGTVVTRLTTVGIAMLVALFTASLH